VASFAEQEILRGRGSGNRRSISKSTEENKALVRRWIEELFNEGDFEVANEIIAPGSVLHDPPSPTSRMVPRATSASSASTAPPSPTPASPWRTNWPRAIGW
jgi:hypothetical protein